MVCCGKGNNGGDGLAIARHLDNASVAVRVLLFADPGELAGDAAVNFRIVEKSKIAWKCFAGSAVDEEALRQELATADWIVDALFGSGLSGPIRSAARPGGGGHQREPGRVFAVDIPSGLDSDTGKLLGPTVRARHTATVVATRSGFGAAEAKEWVGEVHVIEIGVPRILMCASS